MRETETERRKGLTGLNALWKTNQWDDLGPLILILLLCIITVCYVGRYRCKSVDRYNYHSDDTGADSF